MSISKEQRNGMDDHHAEMAENAPDEHALEKFKRNAYESVSVGQYLRNHNCNAKKKIK